MGKLLSQLTPINNNEIDGQDIFPLTDISSNSKTKKITLTQVSDFVISEYLNSSSNPFSASSSSSGMQNLGGHLLIDEGNYILWENNNASYLGFQANDDGLKILEYNTSPLTTTPLLTITREGVFIFKQLGALPSSPTGGSLVYTTEGWYLTN